MAPQKIILDCDPGQDDAIALLLALGSPDEIELLAVTAVGGNVPLALTEKNARSLIELAARTDIPVYAGCIGPLIRKLETAEHVHGDTGINGANLPEPTISLQPKHAVDAIIDLIMSHPAGSIALCPTGPLTNVAMAMVKQPEINKRLKEIVLMGGAIGLGNVTPAAEFNIYVDPHAARIVFESAVPITMFGLDVTHKVCITDPRLETVKAIDNPVARSAYGMLEFYTRYDRIRYQSDGGPLHDPCVIAHLIKPDLFSGRDCFVEIDTNDGPSIGRTVVDWWQGLKKPANVHVVDDANADGFFELLVDRLHYFD